MVNADQTVVLIWDKERQMEHFIRQASFRSGGDSVGFIVPSPSRPQLEEAGDQAFPYLAQITTPKTQSKMVMPMGCASTSQDSSVTRGVQVIEEKTVAGYHAVVLTADSGHELTSWLRDHGYAYTPQTAAWAEPYLKSRWFMTAMKIADKDVRQERRNDVAASALRISFKTDRPLFPYREPDSRADASRLGVSHRLLRIYFVGEARYAGQFPSGQTWSGIPQWSNPLSGGQRSKLLQHLGLPANTGPAEFWLTKFDDHWPYSQAPGDVYFAPSASQSRLAANSGAGWFDPTLVVALGVFLFARRRR